MPRRLLLTTLCALAALALVPAVAAAKRGPCLPGTSAPRCTIWTAKVITVHDGDTFDARVGGRKRRVRMVGLNAMEQRVYSRTPSRRRGACHALEATARLESLLGRGGRRIRLVAQKASSRSRHRIRRAVYVRRGGRWLDVAQVLLSEGHALWLPNIAEYAWHRSHSAAAEQAAARGLRLWDTDSCGRGPSEDVPLRLWMNPDAEGNDNANVNGEWIRVKNLDPSRSVSLHGWWLRDSAHRQFGFPASASIPPGGTITVRMGAGQASADEFFWGLADAVFENPSDDEQARGDGSYLFDPQGDLRARMQYPCRTTCSAPLPGLELSARATNPESVTLRNAGAAALDLEGFRLEASSEHYDFGGNSVVAPGEAMVVNVRSGDGTRLTRYWGLRRSTLDDSGDVVRLATWNGSVAGCHAWGDAGC